MSDQWIQLGAKWVSPGSKEALLFPAVKDILGDISQKSIFDAGCGDGFGCRTYQTMGAQRVVGADISSEQIEKCKKLDTASEYIVADIREFDLQEEFDFITNLYVLQTLSSEKEILQVLKLLKVHLKDDGRLILAGSHPCFDYRSDNLGSMNREFSAPYTYLHDGLPMEFVHRTKDFSFTDLHWSLSAYSQFFHNIGLNIEIIHEPKPIPESEKADPELFKNRCLYPEVILFVLKKSEN